ncbi:aldo/keto reductase [Agromyces sp. MMS24-JH15]|uniref:aldo/keto reductase n=1 Tax=Agromyces sp. MMS24-JH15 TaxID=3243765 RepID=UPI0037482A62
MTETAQPVADARLGASGPAFAPLVLGTNVLGWTADREASFAVLDAFVDGGGAALDTADGYSAWVPGHTGGESERIIGEWAESRGARDRVVIATKVSQHPEFRGLAAANIAAAADASLERLRTDRIDLYYAHFDDPEVPLEETVGAFSALVDQGKVGAIGISNYTPERIDEWFRVTEEHGFHRAVALQPHYNLVEREFEGALRARAEREGLAVFPYFSLAKGFLTGKYRALGDTTADGASVRARAAAEYLDERGLAVLEALDEIAESHAAPAAAVALAWLRQQASVSAPIASARNVEQLRPLLASLALELGADELARLTEASAVSGLEASA